MQFGRKLSNIALDEAITSGEFLDFDQNLRSFIVGPMQAALLALKRNIVRLRHNDEMMDTNARRAMGTQFAKLDGDDLYPVNNVALVPVLSIHDSLANVIALNQAIHLATSGSASALDRLSLYGDSPLDSEMETMENECPSPEEVENWIRNAEPA